MTATAMPDEPQDEAASHYFEDPTVPSDPVIVDVTLPDTAFTMETDTGVFSRGHVDAGTSLLLRSDAALASDGDLLDLGAGSGAIAMTMARRSPGATVWAVDVNSRARHLCRRNAERNNLSNIRVASPDDVPDEVRFSAIWSNPPIRIGKPALRELLLSWLARMTDDGTATLVVQKHLGADSLQRWLTLEGHPTERVASKSGFRLLSVAPGHRAHAPGVRDLSQ
jgi:16S rRNA (guanine1207-N2)-methyltransferase